MIDCTTTCADIGAACATCEQTSNPTEQPTNYRPKPDARRSPFHAAACALVEAAQQDRNGADALDSKTRGT